MTSRNNGTCCRTAPQPTLWFNEIKHPGFYICDASFPAYILPVAITICFIAYKISQYTLAPTREAFADAALQPASMDKKPPQPDTKNQIKTDKESAEAGTANDEDAEPPATGVKKYLGWFVAFYHRAITFQQLFQGLATYREWPIKSSSVEIAILLLTAFVLTPRDMRPHLFAAAGWIALLAAHYFALDSPAIAIGTAALEVPLLKQLFTNQDKHGSAGSSVVVLTLLLHRYLPKDSSVRGPKFFTHEAWPIGLLLAMAVAIGLYSLIKEIAKHSDNLSQATSEFFTDLAKELPEAGRCLVSIAAFLGPMATAFMAVWLASDCLGWRWVIFGLPANSLRFPRGGGFFAGMLFVGVWCLLSVIGRLRSPGVAVNKPALKVVREETVFCTEAAGWTVSGLTGLWVLLSALP